MLNPTVSLVKHFFQKFGHVYTRKEIFHYVKVIEDAEERSLVAYGKITKAIYNKLRSSSNLQYSSLIMLHDNFMNMINDPNGSLSSYVDLIVGNKNIYYYIQSFDLTICKVAIYYRKMGL